MSGLSVQGIKNNIPIDIYSLRHILGSEELTDVQKINFIRRNSTQIKGIMEIELGTEDFNRIMSNRPLMIFKPIKNLFTKNGDRILLAKTLEIPLNEMDDFIKKATKKLPDVDEIDFCTKDKLEAIKTYVYRHGSKEQVIKFMDYEISHAKNFRRTIKRTLDYTKGGVADYFTRPIHRMDNKTFLGLFDVINKNIVARKEAGELSEADALRISRAALARLFQVKENSRLKNSAKLKKELEQVQKTK